MDPYNRVSKKKKKKEKKKEKQKEKIIITSKQRKYLR
jgi:hypothetical protein